MFSFYNTVKQERPTSILTRGEVYALFRSEAYQDATNTIQTRFRSDLTENFPNGKKAYQDAKASLLGAVCFAGNVDRSSGAKNDAFEHSGLLTLDVDENSLEDQQRLFALIQEGRLVNVEAAGRSVSGFLTGALWINVKIEIPSPGQTLSKKLLRLLRLDGSESRFEMLSRLQEGYWNAFRYLFEKDLSIKIGTAGKDLKRVRYVSFDAGLYVNDNAERWSLEQLEINLTGQDQEDRKRKEADDLEAFDALNIEHTEDAFLYAERFAEAKGLTFVPGQKHNFRNAVAIALNLLGVPRVNAEAFILDKYRPEGGLSNEVSFPYGHYKESFGRWSSRIKPKDVSAEDVVKLEAGQRISDHAEHVVNFVLKHGKTDLEAGTGTGKNYAIVKHIAPSLLKKTGQKTIVVCSLNAKAEKDAEQYGIPYLTGKRLKDAGQAAAQIKRDALKAPVLLVNQNYFPKVVKRLEALKERRHVFIDESHTLLATYKGQALRDLWDTIQTPVCSTVTLLSGTPKPYFSLLGYKRLKFVQEQRPDILTTVCHYSGTTVSTILGHILKTDFSKKRLLIKLQSKDKIRLLKDVLLEKGWTDAEIVTLISSTNVKTSDAYQRFLKARPDGSSSFAEQVKIVFCTSFINEGIDIFDTFELEGVNVELSSNFSTDDAVQYADRHRTDKIKTLVSYHKKPKDGWKQVSFNALAEFEECLQYWTNEAERLEALKNKHSDCYTLQRHFTTKTKFGHAENFLTEKEGRIIPDVLKIAAAVDAEAVRRTGTKEGWSDIQRRFPYFKVTFAENVCQDVDPAIQDACKAAIQAGRESAEQTLTDLFDTNKEVLLQAIGSRTEDAKIKRLTTFDASRRDDAKALTERLPDVFEDHFDSAEHFSRSYHKLKAEGLSEDAVRSILVKADGTHTTRQKLTNFLTALRLNVLLTVFAAAKNAYQKGGRLPGLTIQQVQDAKRLTTFVTAIDQAAEKYGSVSGTEAFRALKKAFKGQKDLTGRKAVTLLKALFDVQEDRLSGGAELVYHVSGRTSLTDFLTKEGVSFDDAENYLKNLHNYLKDKLLLCNIV